MVTRTSFEFLKVEDFDDHISQSIPSYVDLVSLVKRITTDYTQDHTSVVDLGCSTGKFLKGLYKEKGVEYIGIDNSFTPEGEGVTFVHGDVVGFEIPASSVVVSLFTLQFLPVRHRAKVIKQVADSLVTGGVFICAEKMHTQGRHLEVSLQNELLHQKRTHFSDTEIVEKSIGLSSVMRCRTGEELRAELDVIGQVDSVWQWGQFICHVATKV